MLNQTNFISMAALTELARLVDKWRSQRHRRRVLAMLAERRKDRESWQRVQEIRGKVNHYAYL